MSGHSLSFILEQFTTSSRAPVSGNGEPAEILVLRFLGTENSLGFQAPGTTVPEFLKRETHSIFRIPGFLGMELETDTPTSDSRQIIDES